MQRHQQGTPTPFHPSNARNGVIEVWDSDGGYVNDFRDDIRASLEAGYDIRVRGSCRSACTQIAGPEFRGYVRTPENPNGQIDIDPRRTGFDVHQISRGYGEKDLPSTIFYMGTFPQEALERARVPDAYSIGPEYYPISGRIMLDAIENMQRAEPGIIRERQALAQELERRSNQRREP